jgi:hypothetical protein
MIFQNILIYIKIFLLLLLFIKLFQKIISFKKSKKKINIDYLPHNYHKDDVYFINIELNLNDDINLLNSYIKDNIQKLKYISQNSIKISPVSGLKYKVDRINKITFPDDSNMPSLIIEKETENSPAINESILIQLVDSLPNNKSLLERIWQIINPEVSKKYSRINQVVQVKKTKEELKIEEIEKMIADINQSCASLDTSIKKAEQSIFLQTNSDIYKKLLKKYPKFIEETQKLYKLIEEKIVNIKKLQSQIPEINEKFVNIKKLLSQNQKINKNKNKLFIVKLDENYKKVKDIHNSILHNYKELNSYITKIEKIQQEYEKEIKEKEALSKRIQREINLLSQTIYVTIDGVKQEKRTLPRSVLKEHKEKLVNLKKQLKQISNEENDKNNNTQSTATSSSSGYNYMKAGPKTRGSTSIVFNDEKENKIKKILEKKYKNGITIKEKISNIFTELSKYDILFSKDIRVFIQSFLKNDISLLNLNTNISKLIKELTIIIKQLNGTSNITGINGNMLKDLTFNKEITKGILIKCLNELKDLDKKPQANQGQANQGQANQGQANQGQASQGQANQGQASQGHSNQGQANEEIIIKTVLGTLIKTVLGTLNKTGKTIEKQFENIFTELGNYSELLSKNIREFMLSASSGFVSLSDYSINIEKIIAELEKIISVSNGMIKNSKLQQKLTKYNSTKSAVITKLSNCKDELTKLNEKLKDITKKYKDFMIIYSKSHPTVFKDFKESSNKQTKKKILDDIQREFKNSIKNKYLNTFM